MQERKRDQGFVSIFSVLIIMTVLTLVAIGFSNVTRRAQRRTLDNQLSTQAFYAAESGVNDARRALAANPAYSKTVCDGQDAGNNFTYDLDTTLNIGYTCVLVNSQLGDIDVDSVPVEGTASPKVVNLESATAGSDIKSFQVEWSRAGTGPAAAIPTTSGYPFVLNTAAGWGNNLGMLRIDLAPTDVAPDRNGLVTGSYTFFLYPTTSATDSGISYTVKNGSTEQGKVLFVRCATSPCRATVSLDPGTSDKYIMRMQSLYNSVKARVYNVQTTGGTVLSLQNGQTVVDVTGKAADVLRRIQVRLPAAINGMMPAFAIQSADTICKRLLVGPTTTVDPSVSGEAACALDVGGAPAPPTSDPDTQRFPGDPNPIITHKSYWGASIGTNGDPARHESAPGITKSLSARRTYWQWDDAVNRNSNMYRVIRDDLNNNRLPFVSIKSPVVSSGSSWQKVGNGTYDDDLKKILTQLDSFGKPVWVVFHHEPEGGGTSGNTPDDIGGPTEWKNMQRRVKFQMNALDTKHLAFVAILMAYTWDNSSGRDPNEWWVPNTWNAFIVDIFRDTENGDMFSDGTWNAFSGWADARGIPYGTGEWGNRGTNAQAAAEMLAFWNWGFNSNKDMVIHSYYDSSANAGPNGSWALTGSPLTQYRDIMQNDAKVQRINDL